MCGAHFKLSLLGAALIVSGWTGATFANDYDVTLERAVMRIVASRIGDIRGPLDKEWAAQREPPVFRDLAEYGQSPDLGQSSSFLSSDMISTQAVAHDRIRVTVDPHGSIQDASTALANRFELVGTAKPAEALLMPIANLTTRIEPSEPVMPASRKVRVIEIDRSFD
jgi:hypothetical protein